MTEKLTDTVEDSSLSYFYTTLITAVHIHYPEETSLGYEWQGNVSTGETLGVVKNMTSGGLQCFVGDTAFDVSGNKLEGMSAILTRKRK